MKQVKPIKAKSRRSAYILFSMAFAIVFAVMGLFYGPDSPAAAEKEDAIVLKIDTPSANALSTIMHRFGKITDLLYLYPATEKGTTVELGFPGKLVVAPDKTPLGDLLSDLAPVIRINAETEVIDQLLQSESPAARIEDHAHHIVAILTTKKVMDPISTGAVMRAPEAETPPQAEKPIEKSAETHQDTERAEASPATQSKVNSEETQAARHLIPKENDVHAVVQDHSPLSPEVPADDGHAANHTPSEKTAHAAIAGPPAKPSPSEKAPSAHTVSAESPAPGAHEKPAHGTTPEVDLPTGVAFVDALIKPLNYELNERFWGWRPNDLIKIGDNVVNFQLGVLEIYRRTAVILAERISRTGNTAAFDPDLENAMNWFMIKPSRYWFPSAESKYNEAIASFEAYKDRLMKGQAKFFNRADNLIPLLMAYEDLLGSCEENLVKTAEDDGVAVSFFKSDDYLFYTKGVVSTLGTILNAIEHDFKNIIESRQAQEDIHHAITSCHHAMEIDPFIVVNSKPSSILANHRANLAAPISHARFYLTVLIKTLST
jgi:hypothetical protein